MNKAKLTRKVVLCSLVIGLVGCDQGSYFNKDTVQKTSDAVSRIEAAGEDLRVYEFTPQTMPDYQCIFVSGEKKGSLQCIKKNNIENNVPN